MPSYMLLEKSLATGQSFLAGLSHMHALMTISSVDSTGIDPELQIILGSRTVSTSFVDQHDTLW